MSTGKLPKDSKEYQLQKSWLKKNKVKKIVIKDPDPSQTGHKIKIKDAV